MLYKNKKKNPICKMSISINKKVLLNYSSSLFHSLGALIWRMLDAHKFSGCSGIWRIAIYRSTIEVSIAARSGSILYVLIRLILKTILCSTGNQCRSLRVWLMWSYLRNRAINNVCCCNLYILELVNLIFWKAV